MPGCRLSGTRRRRWVAPYDVAAGERMRGLVRALREAFATARIASAEAMRLEALAEDAKRVSADADRHVTITRTELLDAIARRGEAVEYDVWDGS